MKKTILGLGVLVMLTGSAMAQDVHFSQFFTSPLTLNPAMTGLLPDDFRLAVDYRNQWSSVSSHPYVTATASFDAALLKGKLPEGDALGLGAMFLTDKSGSGALQNNTAAFSLAYHKGFGRDKLQHFSIGVQGYFVQKSIDFSALTFEDDYNLGTATLKPGSIISNNGEQIKTQSISYPDVNVGAMYSGQIGEHSTVYMGLSYYHLTQPSETFINDRLSYPIHSRYTGYLGGSVDVNEKTIVYASALFQSQASAKEVLVGTSVGFILNPGHDAEYQRNTVFYLGGWYRYADAVIPYVAIEWSKMRIGLSYDVNVSSFTPATSGLGAYELSVIFNGRLNRHERNPNFSWSCPKIF